MDALWELVKSGITLIGLLIVLILVPTLFMFIFGIATSIDERLTK